MKNPKTSYYRAALKGGVASIVLGASLVSAAAYAQDAGAAAPADAEVGTIVVTGSRIARPDLEAASPVSVLGSEEFQLSGAVNVEDVVYDLPQIVPSLTAASNNPGEGVATVDLRGLGASRTLVLVNSRRYVSYDEQQIVDLNTIPAGLIERVDVVTGGRSAIYGSDAIAGVVNFILKDDFEGAQISSNYRITEKGDGAAWTVDGMLGGNFADGRGNATVYASYLKRKDIFQNQRKFSTKTLQDNGDGTTFFGGSSSILGTRFAIGNFGTTAGSTPGSFITQATGNRRFDSSGNIIGYNTQTDQYNFAPANYLQTPQERWFLGGFANYEVNDHLEFFAETQFINSRANTQLAATPVTGTYDIDVDSPFLSPSARATLAAIDASELTVLRDADGNPLQDAAGNILGAPAATRNNGYVRASIGNRFVEAGDRTQLDDRNAFRAVAGARGEITGDWAYEGYYSYARNRNVQTQNGNVSISRFQNALRTSFAADGTLQCADAAARAAGCTPLNIFGPGNALSTPDAVAYVVVPTTNLNEVVEQVAQVSINNGNLFDFGAGPVGIALGAEWRSVSGEFRPDFSLSTGDIVGFNAGEPTKGRYSVKELFAELVVPVLADMPFAEKLELNAAARYSDYSNAVGTAWSYAIGGQYSPIEDITFRGQYQRAVRAPTISQLFLGSSVGFPPATDPCEQPVAATNATLNATCRAQGVPASLIGSEFAGGNSQLESNFGGNPNLTEEKADTYTIGAIIQPRFVDGLTLTVDYYNIEIKDYIGGTGPGATNVIAACYGDANSNFTPYDTSFCALAPRDPDSLELSGIVTTNANLGGLKTEGVDFELRYGMNLGFGILGQEESSLNFRLSGTRLINWELAPIASAAGLINDCTGKFGTTCGDPFAKWRGSARVIWTSGPLSTSVLYRYIHSSKDDDAGTQYFREKFKAEHYFDLSFNYEVNEMFDFTFGVDNLFNNQPQLAGSNAQQANTYPSTYDVFGRRYFFGVTAKF